ncbi:MAG: hypothetical protein K5981_01695 [Clostridia bacterium]|nr:hypothetical protein [Clostridia bacterium]
MFKNKKNNLDERQEQILLQIEHNGCWLSYAGLLIAILVQQVVYKGDFRYVLGEWIVFFALCVYMMYACMKNGIWDRHLKPNAKSNALASLVGGLVVGFFIFLMVFRNFPDKPAGSIAAGVFAGFSVFVLCFLFLSLSARAIKKRQAELESEPEEE